MTEATLEDLQASVEDRSAFGALSDYFTLCEAFLRFVQSTPPTRIISPSHHNYIFYQYDQTYGHRITRPLNVDLFIESASDFRAAVDRFMAFLADLRQHQESAADRKGNKDYVESKEINKVVYTVQQSIGSVGDSFDNPNQSRKRVGQLFEPTFRTSEGIFGVFWATYGGLSAHHPHIWGKPESRGKGAQYDKPPHMVILSCHTPIYGQCGM